MKAIINNLLTKMIFKLRILPALIVCAMLLLGIKLSRVYEYLEEASLFPNAIAQAAPKSAKPAVAKTDAPTVHLDKPEHNTDFDVLNLDPGKVKELRNLSKRRDTLEDRERGIKEKEAILLAVEKRIDEKSANLDKMQKHLNGVMQTKDANEKKATERLVQMYEKMKPTDAASILEGMDLATNIELMESFKEAKASAILAVMDRTKARYLTMQLAQRRKPDQAMEPQPQTNKSK